MNKRQTAIIAGLAAIDIENHTAFHLEVLHNLVYGSKNSSLTDWYADIITSRKESLRYVRNRTK